MGPAHPPSQRIPGALSTEIKRPGRKTELSLLSNAEVKNVWSCTSSPSICFHGVWGGSLLSDHTKIFTFCSNIFRRGEIDGEKVYSQYSYLLCHSLCESSYTNINMIWNICLQWMTDIASAICRSFCKMYYSLAKGWTTNGSILSQTPRSFAWTINSYYSPLVLRVNSNYVQRIIVRFPVGLREFFLHQNFCTAIGSTQHLIQWVPEAFFLGWKLLGH